jgi:hypothetical protein
MESEIKKLIKYLNGVETKFKDAVKAVDKDKNLDMIDKKELKTKLYQSETKIYKIARTLNKELNKKSGK